MKTHSTCLNPLPSRHRGVTLIELVAVLAIASVLLGSAIPSMRNVIAAIRVNAATEALVAGLQLARGESIKRNVRVVMCKSPDGSACAATGDWDQGWIIFADADGNADRAMTEAVIWRESAANANVRIFGNGNVANYVSFAPVGGTQLASGAFQAGTISICKRGSAGAAGQQVVVNAVGRPRVQKAAIPAC